MIIPVLIEFKFTPVFTVPESIETLRNVNFISIELFVYNKKFKQRNGKKHLQVI